jgi:hypothetical protein
MAPPFMNSTGLVTKIFNKMISASQPERFTQDFLKSKLGFDGGSARPFIPLLKRLGFISTDGTPTPLYGKFRNDGERGRAMATAMRQGYREVFERDEYAHSLDKGKFRQIIIEMTGAESDASLVNGIVGTFFALKAFADFDAKDQPALEDTKKKDVFVLEKNDDNAPPPLRQTGGLNLSYTINLNLPETSDVEVFNAIFRSLRENLLKA